MKPEIQADKIRQNISCFVFLWRFTESSNPHESVPLKFPKCSRVGFSYSATQAQPEGLTARSDTDTRPLDEPRDEPVALSWCCVCVCVEVTDSPQVNLHTALVSSGLMGGDVNRAEDNWPSACRLTHADHLNASGVSVSAPTIHLNTHIFLSLQV